MRRLHGFLIYRYQNIIGSFPPPSKVTEHYEPNMEQKETQKQNGRIGPRGEKPQPLFAVLVKLCSMCKLCADHVCAHPSPPLATTPGAEEQYHLCLRWFCTSGPKNNNAILKIRFGFDLVANAFKSFAQQKYFRTVLATDTKVVK